MSSLVQGSRVWGRQREYVSAASLSLQHFCSLHDVQKHTWSLVWRPSSLWSQLWRACLTLQALLCMEAVERGQGCQRAGDGQGGSRAARWLPKDKSSNIQQHKGKGWEEHKAELSRETVPYRAFRIGQYTTVTGLGLGMISKWYCPKCTSLLVKWLPYPYATWEIYCLSELHSHKNEQHRATIRKDAAILLCSRMPSFPWKRDTTFCSRNILENCEYSHLRSKPSGIFWF